MNSISDMNSINSMNSIINNINDLIPDDSITNTNTNTLHMKLRKEEFVTGHDGSNNPFEIVWICSSIIWSCWFYMELLLLLSNNRSCGNSSSLSFRLCRRILLESIIIWFPMVLVQTNYLYPYGSILMIFQIIMASLLTFRRRQRRRRWRRLNKENEFTIIRDPTNGQLSPVKNPSYDNNDNDDADEEEFEILRGSNGRLETIKKKASSSSSQPNNNTTTTNNNNNNNNTMTNNNTTTNTTTTTTTTNDKNITANTITGNLNYVTLYRSTIYYLTFVAILAVDFELFPRKLCKTEINGYGFMDVGAASFVISSGLIQGKSYVNVNNNKKLSTSTGVSWSTVLRPLRNAMPLIIIGILRCILNKEIDYQEHITEYGRHWNFFFTLGVLAIIPTIRKQCILLSTTKSTNHTNKNSLRLRLRLQGVLKSILILLPFLSMLLYQFFLSSNYYRLQEFILSSPRRLSLVVVVPRSSQEEEEGAGMNSSIVYDFFLGNREGILGCIGYIFLHSCGELIGQYYIFNNVHDSNVDSDRGSGTTSTTSGTTSRKGLVSSFISSSSLPSFALSSLGSITILLWILHFGIEYLFQFTVSRRTTNLSFCLWSLAHNITLLWSFKTLLVLLTTNLTNTCQSSIHNYIIPIGMNLINQYGLISFLIANLMTGFINLMIPTIDISDPIAIWIVYIYICGISVVVILYDKLMSMAHNKSTTKLKLKKKKNE